MYVRTYDDSDTAACPPAGGLAQLPVNDDLGLRVAARGKVLLVVVLIIALRLFGDPGDRGTEHKAYQDLVWISICFDIEILLCLLDILHCGENHIWNSKGLEFLFLFILFSAVTL